MVSGDIVRQKLAELADRVERVRANQRPTAAALGSDRNALDVVAFNLMLSVQSASDIAAHLIADEGWRPVTTVAESFERLAERGVIERDTAESMRRAVRFRNIVAHGYSQLDVGMAQGASHTGLADLDRFAREVARWLVAREP